MGEKLKREDAELVDLVANCAKIAMAGLNQAEAWGNTSIGPIVAALLEHKLASQPSSVPQDNGNE